ncbi:hypothetical protein ACHAXS_004525 [Conticribra weissflogii]
MALEELPNSQSLTTFLTTHANSLVCFSATWCGPCKASKPALESLASQYAADPSVDLHCGIVYEHVLGDEVTNKYRIRAFPTYVLFKKGGEEVGRVEGVNFEGIKSMVAKAGCKAMDMGVGHSLGGGDVKALSPEEARAQRLARLGASAAAANVVSAASAQDGTNEATKAEKESPCEGKLEDDSKMDVDESGEGETNGEVEMIDPAENLSKEDLETLTNSMGFSLIRAQKGLLHGNGTVEGAVEWLLAHQEDADIDDPIEKVPKTDASSSGEGLVAQSYKCNECGKILSNMANLELHANKTGHSDFEESTELKKPLTEEEKKAKIEEIKSLLKAKRTERELKEKNENVDREKQRRFMGKEMSKTREQMEMEARKREALMKKKEKEAALKERQRIRAELEKDRRERAANKGKLSSKLGVDGYNPDGIQYDVPADGTGGTEDADAAVAKKPKKAAPSAAKMDEYISKISSYRAGGDGGNCLKILKAYIGNGEILAAINN